MTDAPLPLDPEEPLPREDNPGVDARGRLIEDVAQAEIGQKSGRGALISLVARLSNLFLTLIAQSALGRLLDPSQYGIYAMGQTALAFLLIFREFGLQAAGVQKKTLSYAEASFLFWANLLLIGTLGALGAISAPFVARFYGAPQVSPVLIAMSIAAILGGVSAQHTMILRRQLRFSAIALIDMIALAVGLAVGILVGWLRRDVWALLAMYLVQQGVTSLLSFVVSRWVPGRPNFERATHMPMLKFGAGVTAANVLYYFTNNISAILIGKGLGSALLGHYNRAQQLYQIPSTVLFSSVYVVVFASLSRFYPTPEDYRAFYAATLRRVSMFYMWLSGLLIFAGDDLVRVLIGPGWDIAGNMLRIFAIALVGAGMAQMTGMLYQSQARVRDFQVWGLIDSAIRITCIVISSHWGIYGFAIGFAVSTTFVTAPASLWFAGRKGPVSLRDQIQAITPSTIIFALSLGGAFLGRTLSPAAGPGFVGMVLAGLGSVVLTVAIGLLIPATRAAFIEVLGGIYRILPAGARRFAPAYATIAGSGSVQHAPSK